MKLIKILPFLLLSCKISEENTEKKYFDLSKFIEIQSKKLEMQHAGAMKIWKLNGKTDIAAVSKLDWNKELKLFAEADINKKAYSNSYLINKLGHKTVYNLKESENQPIKKISIDQDSILEIKIISQSKNFIYADSTVLELQAKNNKITNYSIASYHKLIFSSPKTVKISGQVRN